MHARPALVSDYHLAQQTLTLPLAGFCVWPQSDVQELAEEVCERVLEHGAFGRLAVDGTAQRGSESGSDSGSGRDSASAATAVTATGAPLEALYVSDISSAGGGSVSESGHAHQWMDESEFALGVRTERETACHNLDRPIYRAIFQPQ
jgi:hypothetical protein